MNDDWRTKTSATGGKVGKPAKASHSSAEHSSAGNLTRGSWRVVRMAAQASVKAKIAYDPREERLRMLRRQINRPRPADPKTD